MIEDPTKLASSLLKIVNFFYPHVARLICKILPDENSLSLKIKTFLTSETTKMLNNGISMAGGEYFNARARLIDGLILLNGMVPTEGATILEMHQMFLTDSTKTEQRRKIIHEHLTSALDSANKCFAMGKQSGQTALTPEQMIDVLHIRIFCTTLQTLEAFAPHLNYSAMVDTWITSVKFLYDNPIVKANIDKNVKRKWFRNKKLFKRIKSLLLALDAVAVEMQPRGGERDLVRLKKEVHESHLLKHHRFLADDILRMTLRENESHFFPIERRLISVKTCDKPVKLRDRLQVELLPEESVFLQWIREERKRFQCGKKSFEIGIPVERHSIEFEELMHKKKGGGFNRISSSNQRQKLSLEYHKDESESKVDFNFPFPSKSILLVGGLSCGSVPLIESYCTQNAHQSTHLDTKPQIPRYNHVGCKIGPTTIIISGGQDKDTNVLKSTEFFHLNTREWYVGPEMNLARYQPVSACIDDILFVFGGHTLQKESMTAEKFQMSSTWQSVGNLPAMFIPGGAVALGRKIILMGIQVEMDQQRSNLQSTLLYDPSVNQYIPAKPMYDHRCHFGSTFLDNNTLMVTGGNAGDRSLTSVDMFDIRTDEWTVMKSMENARECHQLVNVDEKLYALGGYDSNKDDYPFSVEMFDLRNNKWSNVAQLMENRVNFTAFTL